jgi:hypothetical protein
MKKYINKQTNKHIVVDLSIYAVDCVNCLNMFKPKEAGLDGFGVLTDQTQGVTMGHQPSKRRI